MPIPPKHLPISAHTWLSPGLLLVALLAATTSNSAIAESIALQASAPLASATPERQHLNAAHTTATRLQIDKSYALGIANFDLDHETEVTGWQVGDRWFFGRQRGLDSGLTLVWQEQANQVSVSRDGVRFTRRF